MPLIVLAKAEIPSMSTIVSKVLTLSSTKESKEDRSIEELRDSKLIRSFFIRPVLVVLPISSSR